MAVLDRAGGGGNDSAALAEPEGERIPAFESFWRETFAANPPRAMLLPDGRVMIPPALMPRELRGLHIVRAGVLAGEIKNARFTPDHALALAYPESAFGRSVPLAGGEQTRFLAGETTACPPELSDWCAVTAFGYPVGWGKAVDGVLKNHIPKGLRIR